MRIALLQHPWQLTFRGKWDWSDIYNDPRGMSGSELGFVEIGRRLYEMGHEVTMFTDSEAHTFANGSVSALGVYPGFWVLPWKDLARKLPFDLAIGINHAGGLEHFDCPKAVMHWLNSVEYIKREHIDMVDLWLSPSETHLDYMLSMTHQTEDGPDWEPDPAKWAVAPLGCDVERYKGIEKVRGRVIYASSPDRGLHHLLQAWPGIKARAPHAHLKIYYRILPWIAEIKTIPEPFPPCEELRQRALFIEDALRRLGDPKWGIEVVGPVSRRGIEQAMGEAQVLAYPVDTTRFSEGFSVTTLEACAARACPVVYDCDAIGEVYRDVARVVPRGGLAAFTDEVVRGLTEPYDWTEAEYFAEQHSWRSTCEKILKATYGLTRPIPGPSESAEDSSSSEAKASETPAAASPT